MGSLQWQWCPSCTKMKPVERNSGFLCCTDCGKILEDVIFSDEPNFVKNAAGQSHLAGNYVRTVQSENSASRERTLYEAYDFITHMAEHLGVAGGDQIVQLAVRFYRIAVEKKFVQGRVGNLVRAACLYIACRENNKPYLLIEFSEFLRVNIYVLGAVFLQLCKLLHLEEHPIVQKPLDPSLFIHRYANSLLGEKNNDVVRTALLIMASMKLNWMQTGRKPSGLCGAAFYISGLSHGLNILKTQIVKTLHICEATLTKRLIEFEGTESGGLTIEELEQKAKELENNYKSNKHTNFGDMMSEELLCQHKGSGKPQFAHGLCETCYHEFIQISGGLDGGLAPPAFQRAERERLAKPCADEMALENSCKSLNVEEMAPGAGGIVQLTESGFKAQHEAVDVGEESGKANEMGVEGDELENLSDIDDEEVDNYVNSEEEQCYKKIIWESMNPDFEVIHPESIERRQRKRAAEVNIAQTAAEAAYQMLSKKRISSRLNYDRLNELLEPEIKTQPQHGQSDVLGDRVI